MLHQIKTSYMTCIYCCCRAATGSGVCSGRLTFWCGDGLGVGHGERDGSHGAVVRGWSQNWGEVAWDLSNPLTTAVGLRKPDRKKLKLLSVPHYGHHGNCTIVSASPWQDRTADCKLPRSVLCEIWWLYEKNLSSDTMRVNAGVNFKELEGQILKGKKPSKVCKNVGKFSQLES